ncbi:hypothetical protein FRC19_011547 [Serendipita sp. 401]|nr:hypothetical protein FRC19_011547 [Serendipita sp. 401]
MDSAVERVPIEIWENIHFFALETWLLPSAGGDILDSILLFHGECTSVVEYSRVENVRRRLRSVCRVWKAIVDNLSIDFTLSNFAHETVPSEYYLPRSKRIEFLPKWKCMCERCPWVFSGDRDASLREYWRLCKTSPDIITQLKPPFDAERARIILLDFPGKDMADYVHQAPRLTAFKGTLSNIYRDKGLEIQTIFNRLTHLTLSDLSPKEMVSAYQLPHLRFLQVSLQMGPRVHPPQDSYVPLWRWVLPKLVSLVVRGAVNSIYREDLLQFLRSHSSKVEGLVIDYKDYMTQSLHPLRFDTDPFRHFLRLKTIGVTFQTLDLFTKFLDSEDEKKAYTAQPIICESLLLDDIHKLIGLSQDLVRVYARLCFRLFTLATTLFHRIVIIHSWDELVKIYEAYVKQRAMRRARGESIFAIDSELTFPRIFFEIICRAPNLKIVDRDGTELRNGDGEGVTFLEKIKLMETDPDILKGELYPDLVAGRWRFSPPTRFCSSGGY